MQLTIVIPARNEETALPRQLNALLEQQWDKDWEVLVVDNGSTDGTARVVAAMQERYSRLRLVSEPTAGLCHARNTGIAEALAGSVAVCDADDIVSAGWVGAMGDALAAHDLVTGSLELNRLNEPWLARSRGRSDEGAPTFHSIFPYPMGNNFGLRKKVIERIGNFDQKYVGAEDVEFGFRAWRAGIELHHEHKAVVHYAYRSKAGELWRQGVGYGKPRPAIAKALKQAGVARPPRLAGWKSWVWLLVNTWRLASRRGRARWSWVAGNRIGHLEGSIRHRTVLL